MRKISNGLYEHRGSWIWTDNQGICVEDYPHIFKTYTDARLFIDKILDGTHKREPKIIGEWKMENQERR
jgi:hypothetical protein